MGLLSLLYSASSPVLQVILLGGLGTFLASGRIDVLTPDALINLNKVVFYVFTPSLLYASLAKTVTLQDIISWWYMPVNIGLTFLVGGVLGWIIVKLLRPQRHLEGIIIAICSSGNLGNLLLILVPAICKEKGTPFGEERLCSDRGFSYVSLSMALGSFYIWTFSYSLVHQSANVYEKLVLRRAQAAAAATAEKNSIAVVIADEAVPAKIEIGEEIYLNEEYSATNQTVVPLLSSGKLDDSESSLWSRTKGAIHLIAEELIAPANIAAIVGFVVGVVPWLKSLLVGNGAPLRMIQDSITTLGGGNVPCTALILGGNLGQGFRKNSLGPLLIATIVVAKYIVMPIAGMGLVAAAGELGLLPRDPLFRYVMLIQFALPPATNIGTMAQIVNVGQEECSVIFMWAYLAAAPALTVWSAIFLMILSRGN